MEKISQYPILIKVIEVIAILILAFIIKKISSKLINKIEKRTDTKGRLNGKNKTVFSIMENVISFIIYFLAITQILGVFNINTTSILAAAGVAGMALAFASQSVIEDVISGGFILLENQYEIGHSVKIDNVEGVVKKVGMRLTVLEGFDGKGIIIPNGQVTTVINNSINPMRALVDVYISDSKPIEEVFEKLEESLEITKSKTEFFIEDPRILGVEAMMDHGYVVRIVAKVVNDSQWAVQRMMREDIIKVLQEADINFSNIGRG